MALVLLGDLVIYNEQITGGYLEGLAYVANLFNNQTNGAFRITSTDMKGLTSIESYFKDFGSVTRRDPTTQAAVASSKIGQDEHGKFKVFRSFPPIEFAFTALKTAGYTDAQIMFYIGRKLAEKKMLDNVRTSIAALRGAIGTRGTAGIRNLDTTIKATDPLKALALMGDRASELSILVMHSKPFFDLAIDQIENFKFAEVAGHILYGGSPATFGKPILVTDTPELIEGAGTVEDPTKYTSLFLTSGAVTIEDNGDTKALSQMIGGQTNIAQLFQAEWDSWLNVKGYDFDITTAGTNPDNSALADVDNWTMWVNDIKLSAGLMLKSL